jgi:hypothetical protein
MFAISHHLLILSRPPKVHALFRRTRMNDPIVYTAVAGQADVICTIDRHFYHPNVLSFCGRQRILLMTDVELLHALRSMENAQ